jgi:hypothetical protein
VRNWNTVTTMTATSSRLAVMLIFVATSGASLATDQDDVAAVIHRYAEFQESGEWIAQGGLMLPDRVGVWDESVHLDNTQLEMSRQQAGLNTYLKRYPGLKFHVELSDLQIRVWDDVAVATFHMHTDRIIPPGLSTEQRNELSGKLPIKLSCQTLVKRGGTWKIAATVVSFIKDREP